MSEPEFELIVGEESGEIHNADIPVRWCVTPELVKNMEDAGIVDPHVLLLTATASGQEIQRQVVPITELMTYARYTKAGDMRLYGWIVNGEMGRKQLHKALTRMIRGEYSTNLIDKWDNFVYEDIGDISYAHVGVKIEIPDGVFGKEPSPWVKWFSNLWHKNKTDDQCHFRRRMIFAFTLKWIPVLAYTTFVTGARALAAVFFAGIGYHKFIENPKYILRPFDAEYSDVFGVNSTAQNVFLFHRNTKYVDVVQTHIIGMAIVPLIPTTVFLLSLFAQELGEALLFTGSVMAVLLAFTATIDALVAISIWYNHTTSIAKFRTYINDKWDQFDKWMSKANYWRIIKWGFVAIVVAAFVPVMIQFWSAFLLIGAIALGTILLFGACWWIMERFMFGDQTGNDYTEIRELLCPKDELNIVASYDAIPKKQRSLRLWYLDTKNKVCKPMQL